jgi:hypothetical protein
MSRIGDCNPIPNAEIMADGMVRYNIPLVLTCSGKAQLAKNRHYAHNQSVMSVMACLQQLRDRLLDQLTAGSRF